uniref:EndoU domain-containing protein n=1 Tax=Sebaldella termitidis TaxID=826 RepID=UPI003EBCD41F
NSFYENILNGSSTLETGNREYSSIDEGKLDFCSNPLQCPNYRFDYDKKQSVPVEKKKSSIPIGAGLPLDLAETLTKLNTISKYDKEMADKYYDLLSENKFVPGKLAGELDKELQNKNDKIIAEEAAKLFNEQKAGIELYEQYRDTDYLTKGYISDEKYNTPEFKNDLANTGVTLMLTGHPAGIVAGAFLAAPKGLDYLYAGTDDFKNGNIEGGIQNFAGLAALGLIGGISYQNSNGALTQTTAGKDNNKFFNRGDGIYTLENGTSEGYLSGNNFVRVNYVNRVATNAYGRIDGNTLMLDRTSVGAVPGTSLISSGMTSVLGLPGTSQTNVSSLTYTPTEVRPSQIFISNPATGVTEVFHNGLSGLIPTYSPPTDGIIYNQHPYYGFYPATDISTLNNTSIFREGALPHILDGDVKVKLDKITGLPKKENVSGYHSNTITGIPTIDPSTIIVDPVTGVYKAKVINPISGTVKGGNQGYSTFFPDNWTAQQKVDAMNEAYNNRVFDAGNQYTGTYGNIKIRMYLDANKEVISAFPEF